MAKPRQKKNAVKNRMESKKARQRFRMLNVHFLAHFKYDLNEILVRSDMDDSQYVKFTANLITKASRNGISDARTYVDSVFKDEVIDESSAERIKKLLQRYSKLR